jgi:hypothetical protein
MLAAGVEFIGAVQHSGRMSWQHFCCPDGTVLEIIGPGTPPAQLSPAGEMVTSGDSATPD